MNLLDMQTFIAARMSINQSETATMTQITMNINREYQQVCQKYKLIQKYATLSPNGSSAAPLNALITMPSDLLDVEAMQFSTSVPELVDAERMAKLAAITAAGNVWWGNPTLPMFYTYESPQTIYIAPAADLSTPTGTLFYTAKPPSLVNGTDQMQYTNALGVASDIIPEPFHVWICERAIVATAMSEQDVYGAELGNALRCQPMENDFRDWHRRRVGKIPSKIALAVYNEFV